MDNSYNICHSGSFLSIARVLNLSIDSLVFPVQDEMHELRNKINRSLAGCNKAGCNKAGCNIHEMFYPLPIGYEML